MRCVRLVAVWVLAAVRAGRAHAADPSALWKIVNGECVPHEQQRPRSVALRRGRSRQGVEKGFAILKDIRGHRPVPADPDSPDRRDRGPGNPGAGRDELLGCSLAGPPLRRGAAAHGSCRGMRFRWRSTRLSAARRISCISISTAFARTCAMHCCGKSRQEYPATWAPFPVPLAGHDYRSIRINQASLGSVDPFRVAGGWRSVAETTWG